MRRPLGQKIIWIGVPPPLRRRAPPSRHVLLALPAAGRDMRRNDFVHGPSRPRSVSVVGWVTTPARPRLGSRRTRRLGRVALPGARPGREPPGRLNQGRVVGARKAESETRSKRAAQANAVSVSQVFLGTSSALKSRGSGVVPYTILTRLSSGPTPIECRAARGPPTSAAAHSRRRCVVSSPFRLTGRI